MPVDAITGTVPSPAANAVDAAAGRYATAAVREPKQKMDGDMFMSLLITQLRNQDPSSPMDTNQMIAQSTQLAMMEKLTELSGTSKEDFSLQMRTAAAALIGQTVSWTGADGSEKSGVGTAVSFAGEVPRVTVGKDSIALDELTAVTAKP